MADNFQTRPILGTGIYTIPDIAMILGIKYYVANKWINTFWNDRFGKKYGRTYSWNIDLTKAINFPTLIELFTFYQLHEAGVSTKEILRAHEILSGQFNTPFPFAQKTVLNQIRTDGKKVLFEQKDGSIYSVDVYKQFKIAFIKDFFKNLDFDQNSIANRLWPMGKEKSIVCDPHHQFGQPVIEGTNIQSEAIYRMYLAKEPINFIASLYEIPVKKVKHAIEFHSTAA